MLKLLAGDFGIPQVNEDQVIIRAAADEVYASLCETVCERLAVIDNSPGIFLEFGLERLAEADRFCGDNMLERTSLIAGENRLVDCRRKLLFAEDQTAARTSESLMGVVTISA